MRAQRRPLISVVLPAFNECEGLPKVISSVSETLASSCDLEILVVDDGSTDGTREAMLDLCRGRPDLRYLRLSRNFGKEAALSAGLRLAKGEAVILMDSDGQHPVSLLPQFVERWQQGFEVVAGVQRLRTEPPLKKRFKRLYYRLMGIGSKVTIPPDAGDFRLLDRKVVDAINMLPERNRQMKGLYAWVGFRTAFIPFQAEARLAGETKFTWAQLFGLGFTGITSFTVVPLRLVSAAGLLISMTSLIYGLYLLFEHFVQHDHLAGWATLAVGMMFFSGVQLLALGVIAEYLGRTFEEAKQRPLYIIAEDSGEPARPPMHAGVFEGAPILVEERSPEPTLIP